MKGVSLISEIPGEDTQQNKFAGGALCQGTKMEAVVGFHSRKKRDALAHPAATQQTSHTG